MKKFLCIMLMLLTLGVSGFAQSAITVTLGDTTATTETYSLPFDNFYNNTWTQTIYDASEIQVAGMITSIAYYVNSSATSAVSYNTVTIYMGTTSATEHATTSDWLPMAALTPVYTTTNMPLPMTTGWQTIQLDQPFLYDGSENLVVVISKTMTSYHSALKYKYTSVTNSSLYRQNDSDASYAQHPGTNTGTRSAYRPNMKLTINVGANFCYPVTNLTLSNLTSTGATINWDASNSSGVSYILQYKTAYQTWDNATTENVYDTTYDLAGMLTATTDYNVRVATDCSGDTSLWKNLSFTTPCAAISALPFTEGFDTYNTGTTVYPTCWGRINTYTSGDRPYVNSTHYEGVGSLYFYGTSGTYNIAIAPPFDASIPVNTLLATFMYRATNSTDYMIVGVMTNPANANTFVPVDTIYPYSTVSTWVEREVNFSTYTGNGQYIAFYNGNPIATCYAYIDNLVINLIPSCPKPKNVAAVSATLNSIELTWTEMGSATTWDIEYGPTGFTQGTGTVVTAPTKPYTITGLNDSQQYDFYVRSDCGGGDISEFSNVYTAGTDCAPISTLPFADNFDSHPGTTGTAAANANLPYCWNKINTGTSYTGLPNIYTGSTYAASGNNSLRFYMYTSTAYDDQMVVLPEIDPTIYPANTLQVSFEARNNSSYTFTLVVGVMTDPTNKTTFVPIDTIETTSNTYATYDIPLNQYTGTGSHIALMAPKPASSYNAGYVDNLVVDVIPTCPRPKNLVASNATQTSMDLTWTEMGNATEWEIEYGPMGFTQGTGTVVSVTNNPYTLNGLTHSTGYDFYVRANCGGGDLSNWSNKCREATACAPITNLPLMENFDAYEGTTATAATASDVLPYCWSNLNTGSSYAGLPNIYANSSYSASGNNSLRFYTYTSTTYDDQIAILPQIDVNTFAINTLQISMDVRDYSTSYPFNLFVGVMTNPNDKTTFVPVDTITTSATNYANYVVTFDNYTGTGSYIALMAPSSFGTGYNYGQVDNLVLEIIPTCPRPTNFVATSTITDEVVLSWTDNNASSWDILYGTTGFDPNTEGTLITGVTNPYTVSGLTNGVIYDFYVRADCGNNDYSVWSIAPATASPFTITMGITGIDTVTGCDFIVTDDGGVGGDYSNNCQYTLVIYPGEADSVVSISGTFVGESTIDYLSVYNGSVVDENSLLQKIVSGTTGTVINFGPLSSTTGPLTLLFHSDGSVVRDGFIAQVSCVEAPACPVPFDVHATNITNNEANVAWDVMSGTSFNVLISTNPNVNPATSTDVFTVYATDYTFSGLTPYTNYYVFVQNDCGADVSAWTSAFGFRTSCDPIVTLPFTENFDSSPGTSSTAVATSNLPYCWSNINEGTSSSYSGYPIVYSDASYAASGSNSMRFYSYYTAGTYDDQIAVLPLIDPTMYPVNTLQLSFDARQISTSYPFTLVVGVLSSPNDKNTFVPVDTINVPSTTYQHYEIPFNTYQGNGNYIALMGPKPSTNYNQGYVDNIIVEAIPNCPKPVDFMLTSIGATSVDLTWTEVGDATTWEIFYGPHGFTPNDTSSNYVQVTNIPYTLDNLTPSTTYDIYLRSDCGSEYSPYSYNVITVTTACLPIDSLPYVQGFDTYGTGTGVYLPCWEKINTYTSTNYPYITTTHYEGVGSLYMYAGTSGTYNIAITPMIDENIPVNTLQASFMYRSGNATSNLVVGVMTNPADATTFVPVDTVMPSAASTWEGFEVSFNQYTGNGHYIAFRNAYNTTTGYGYLDNVIIDLIPTCPRPLHVTASNPTTTSVDLTWDQAGTPNSWVIEYGPSGFTPGNGTQVVATTNPFTVTGLNPSSVYDFYVTADCGGGDSSATSFVCHAVTSCAAITALPYIDNFDAYGTGTTIYPFCWSRINTYTSGDRPYVNSTCYAGVGSLYFYGTSGTYNIAITPEFDATIPINTLQATFMYRASSAANDKLIVGVMTNPNDATSFVPVDTVYPASTASTWVEKEVVFSSYTGNGHYIAFYNGSATTTCYSYIDNLNINLISTCPKPQDLAATNVTASSVTLDWNPTGSETSWEIAYGANGFDPNGTAATIVTANAHPFTVQNLNEATSYEFYVRAVCGGSDYSYWNSNSATATTLCTGTVALPYAENFDGYSGTVYNDPNGIAPACWTTYSTNATYGAPHITGSGSYHYVNSGTNCMVFTCGSAGSDAYAALPTFDHPLNTLTINFWRAMESATNGSTLTVGYVTNLGDLGGSFVTVATIPSVASGSGDTISVDFTGANVPANGNICFHWNYASSFYSCCIDDIVVTSDGSTPVITDPTVATNAASSVEQTTATLNATITNPDNVTITAKGFEWKATTGGTYTQIAGTGTGNTFTANLTGLTANTSYTFKAFITYNGTTVYGNEMTFTTNSSSVTPPTVTTDNATNITTHTATLNGTVTAGTETVMVTGFEWKATVGGAYTPVNVPSTWMFYDLTGLTPNTGYTFRAFAITASGTTYGNEQTFTTLETCAAPTNVTASNITNNSADISWTQQGDVTSWDVNYRVAGADAWNSATTTTNPYTLTGLSESTTYEVQVIAYCTNGVTSDPSATITLTTVGINDYELNNVVVYPNPTTGMIQIQNPESRIQDVEVYDAYGKMLNAVTVNDHATSLDLSGYASGTYFVKIVTENGVVTKRVVKQ